MRTQNNFKLKISFSALVLLTFSGCASIVSDTEYSVTITSAPNAKFIIKDEQTGNIVHTGSVPQTVVLDSSVGFFKGAKYRIEAEKEGYDGGFYRLSAEVDPWYFGNLAFGGPIGLLIVDPLTGAMWKLPEQVNVVLYPSLPATESPSLEKIEPNDIKKRTHSKVKRTAKEVKHSSPQKP